MQYDNSTNGLNKNYETMLITHISYNSKMKGTFWIKTHTWSIDSKSTIHKIIFYKPQRIRI